MGLGFLSSYGCLLLKVCPPWREPTWLCGFTTIDEVPTFHIYLRHSWSTRKACQQHTSWILFTSRRHAVSFNWGKPLGRRAGFACKKSTMASWWRGVNDCQLHQKRKWKRRHTSNYWSHGSILPLRSLSRKKFQSEIFSSASRNLGTWIAWPD